MESVVELEPGDENGLGSLQLRYPSPKVEQPATCIGCTESSYLTGACDKIDVCDNQT